MQNIDLRAFDLLVFFLEHCAPGFPEDFVDDLGGVFWAGLMAAPDLVDKLHASKLFQPFEPLAEVDSDEDRAKKGDITEVVLGKRYKITIRQPRKL